MPNLELQVNNNDPMLQQFSDQNLLGIRNESIAALMVLGYAEREADSAVSKAFQEMQANEIEINLNALLKLALKHLSIL